MGTHNCGGGRRYNRGKKDGIYWEGGSRLWDPDWDCYLLHCYLSAMGSEYMGFSPMRKKLVQEVKERRSMYRC